MLINQYLKYNILNIFEICLYFCLALKGLKMRITVLSILSLCWLQGITQNIDFGVSFGASNYSGDLTESVKTSIQQSHPCFGMYVRAEIDPVFSLRLHFMQLSVSGDDRFSTRPGIDKRNLKFDSKIQEIGLYGQFQLLSLFLERSPRLSPYLEFGISAFHFNPTTGYFGNKVVLRDLGTEGQGMLNYDPKYALYSYALNFGFGLRYFISSSYSVSVDMLARQTSTDYLDDASKNYVSYQELLENNGPVAAALGNKIKAPTGAQRANPADKDWYQSVTLGFSYHFGKKYHYFNPSLQKHQIRCPHF